MLRVAHVTPAYPPATSYGGPLISVSELCQALAASDCDVRVLTTDADGPGQRAAVRNDIELDRNDVRVRYTHSQFDRPGSVDLLRLLPSYVRWADVVHVTGVYSFHTLPTLAACRLLDTPVVWSPRGSFQRWEGRTRASFKNGFEQACRVMAPQSMLLHATSEAEATDCRRFGKRSLGNRIDVRTIPNGVHVPDVARRPAGRTSTAALRLLFVGRIHPIKALDRLLEACAVLRVEQPSLDWALDLAGSGDPAYLDSLKALAKRLKIGDRITFHGDLRDQPKRELFAQSDALVLPSHSENFGLVVVEALAEGLPVIASMGTPWRTLEERGCGFWVANEPTELAAAIVRMSAAPRATMGECGRQWMLEEFEWSRIAQAMIATYREVTR